MKKRIGLVLASVHTGSSKEFWSDLALQAKEHGDSLFVFPGGRLSCQDQYEYLRGSIYSLVNKENLDALVSWASSLGGSVSLDELSAFHEQFEDFPYVTYSLKRPGHPNVQFDAYGGMASLVIHCILVHGAKKIAFLRGPENHQGALDRYRAYTDALQQSGLPFDEKLVSSPVAWHDGAKALQELLEERHLVPGKDFDTLVCSSDMMLFAAGKILEAKGYVIPDDLRLVGFNDTEESLLLRTPCTTVHMPIQKMALMAYSMVSDLAERKGSADADILLPAPLVIRQSCGCTDTLGGEKKAEELFSGNKEAFLSWLEDTFPGCLSVMSNRKALQNAMHQYFKNGGDALLVDEAIGWYGKFFCEDQKVVERLRSLLLREKDLVDREASYEQRLEMQRLNKLECALLCSHSLDEISKIIRQYLPEMGVTECYLVLQQNDNSVLAGGFSEAWSFSDRMAFPSKRLLPEQLSSRLGEGVYVIEPLFMENQPLGYAVLKTSEFSGSLMEELRTSLSSAVKGTLLFDAANNARAMAENAERTKTEFLANISIGLKEPLDEILSLSTESGNAPMIKKEVDKANHLVELAISQTGSLEMEFMLVRLAPDLPPVRVDKERYDFLMKSLSECIENDGGNYSVSYEIHKEGLACVLSSSLEQWQASLHRQDPLFCLAERIVMLCGGRFNLVGNEIRMVFPWPNLGQQALPVMVQKAGLPCYLGDNKDAMPAYFDDTVFVDAASFVQSVHIPQGISVLIVDAEKPSFSLQLAIHQLEEMEEGMRLPVICLHCPVGHATLREALHASMNGASSHPVFVVGTLPQGLERLGLPSDFIMLQDIAQFEGFAAERAPALVVLSALDGKLIQDVRSRSTVPILVVQEKFEAAEVESLVSFPGVVIANSCVCACDEFLSRMEEILGGKEILPPLTGILVKRAVVYLNRHATSQISRWQLAEAVNVSEDYLTRIFRKEEGLSPWDYLNRYRIHLAIRLLKTSTLTINEVASQSGFQDQAYFCRVFKKAVGCNPGKIRQRKS